MTDNWGTLKEDPIGVMEIIKSRINKKKHRPHATIESELNHLIPLHIGTSENKNLEVELSHFRQELKDFLNSEAGKAGLWKYINLCDDYAMRGTTDGFEPACSYRSVLQLLNDEFVPWVDIDIPTLVEDMEGIDETLLDVAEDAPPIREHEIPDWIPESHWWWRAPKKQDMSEKERYWRHHYEETEPP